MSIFKSSDSKPDVINFESWERDWREIDKRHAAQMSAIVEADTAHQVKRGGDITGAVGERAQAAATVVERKRAAALAAFSGEKFAILEPEARRLATQAATALRAAAEAMTALLHFEDNMALFCTRTTLPGRPRIADQGLPVRAMEFAQRVERMTAPAPATTWRVARPPLAEPDYEVLAR